MSNNHHLSLRASPAASSGTAAPTSGSQTILQAESGPSQPSATLRLRGASPSTSSGRRIQWAEDVIDNEGMGKKSSKVCCIYHKPHEPGDSGSDSSSSSESDSNSEPDLSRAKKAGSGKGRGRKKEHDDGDKDGEGKGGDRKPSPNAYERKPKHRAKPKQKG